MDADANLAPSPSVEELEGLSRLLGRVQPKVKQPSAFVASLAVSFVLAPELTLEEDLLRSLFRRHARAEGLDENAEDLFLEATSLRLRAEGILP